MSTFAPEDCVLLRLFYPDNVLVQLLATQAVVGIRLRSPLSCPAYAELSRSVSPDHPVACKVQLGGFDMTSLKFYGCELCVEPTQPQIQCSRMDPTLTPVVERKRDLPPAISGRFKRFKLVV